MTQSFAPSGSEQILPNPAPARLSFRSSHVSTRSSLTVPNWRRCWSINLVERPILDRTNCKRRDDALGRGLFPYVLRVTPSSADTAWDRSALFVLPLFQFAAAHEENLVSRCGEQKATDLTICECALDARRGRRLLPKG